MNFMKLSVTIGLHLTREQQNKMRLKQLYPGYVFVFLQ